MGLPIHIKPAPGRYRVRVGDLVLGQTGAAVILEEAGHGPVLYVPRADMDMTLFTPTPRASTCPWKGQASYFSVAGLDNVVWSYETPLDSVAAIAGHLAFYPAVTVETV
ncbi:DUF427 domain-containing protein [bacterium]|nr:DUF427 domain-containing protein [bacterium]